VAARREGTGRAFGPAPLFIALSLFLYILDCAAREPAALAAAGASGGDAASEKAEKMVRRGLELRRGGKDEEALEVFRAAYALRPTANAQAQIALAEQALGLWVDAERDLGAALEQERDPWIKKNGAVLRGAMNVIRQHLGSVQLSGTPAGARVKLDERDVGTLPFDKPVRVTAGEVVVSISAPGYTEISRKVTVSAGGLTREVFVLHPEATAAPTAGTAPEPTRALHPEAAGRRREDEQPAGPTRPEPPGVAEGGAGKLQYWGVAIAAAGVVAAGVGTVFTVQAISKNNESKPGCPMDMCDAVSRPIREQALTAGNRATVAFVVAGALVGTGAVVFVLGRRSGARSTTIGVTPAAGPQQIGLLSTLSF